MGEMINARATLLHAEQMLREILAAVDAIPGCDSSTIHIQWAIDLIDERLGELDCDSSGRNRRSKSVADGR